MACAKGRLGDAVVLVVIVSLFSSVKKNCQSVWDCIVLDGRVIKSTKATISTDIVFERLEYGVN